MGVPAHDQRDFEFARKYDLPIQAVIQPKGERLDPETMTEAYCGAGVMVNSGPFDGLDNEAGKKAVTDRLENETRAKPPPSSVCATGIFRASGIGARPSR